MCIAVNAAALSLGAGFAQKPPALACDAALTALFTPRHPQLGLYEVCTSPEPLRALAERGWRIDTADPLDALGTAASLDRARVARLFGGRRATIARGWRRLEHAIESVTLMSPYPNPELTRLVEGTLVIRHVVPD